MTDKDQNYEEFEILDATEDITMEEDNDSKAREGIQMISQDSEDSIIDTEVKIKSNDQRVSPSSAQQNYQMQYMQQNMKKPPMAINDNLRQYDNYHEQQQYQQNNGIPSAQKKSQKKQMFNEDDDSSDTDEEEEQKHIDFKKKVLEGSFLPAMVLLKHKMVNVEDIIEQNQGLKLMHYACYFGKIKALKTLTEIYKADINAIDYRGQTPLHVASVSGELGPLIYLCNKGEVCNKEVKDNALMTPLMNTVSSNSEASFIYLYFQEQCDLKNVDINGFTILHLAARSNSVNIAKLLKHIYEDSVNDDYMAVNLSTEKANDLSPEKSKSPDNGTESPLSSSKKDTHIFFDLDRQNSQGQTPIFMTVASRSAHMLKFLLRNNCKITIKDSKGDNIRDHIYRYMQKDTILFDIYVKEENKIIIEKIFSNESIGSFKESLFTNFKCNKMFLMQFARIAYQKLAKNHCFTVLALIYIMIYLLHWLFVLQSDSKVVSIAIHILLLLIGIVVFFFNRQQTGQIEKMHIFRDKDTSLIGQLLQLMEMKQLHKIEELSSRYCYDCLIIRSKYAQHCKDCNSCINYRHKHSKFFNRCIGQENALFYFYFSILNSALLFLFIHLSLTAFSSQVQSSKYLLQAIEGAFLLWDYSSIMFIFTFFVGILYSYAIDDLIWMTVAISRNMTLQQLKNVWAYKHCFDVKTSADESKNYFSHKYYPLWHQIKNVLLFAIGRSQLKVKSGTKKVKSKSSSQQYIDLENTSRSIQNK